MHRAPSPPRTGLAIAAIAAIPVASVSGVAVVADVASSDRASGPGLGLVAAAVGILSGLLVVRLVRSIGRGIASLSAAVVRWCAARSRVAPTPRRAGLALGAPVAPVVAFLPSAILRRGPPVVGR